MNIYIPSCYASWLQTTPLEGQVMLVALVTNFAHIYGIDTYLEFENPDLDIVNHTAPRGFNYAEIKKLKTLGILDMAKGADMKTTIRLAKNKVIGLKRQTIFHETVEYKLSLEGTLIWTYLMGRLANVDENTEVTPLNKIRQFETSEKSSQYKGKEKTATTHIIPLIYREQFGHGIINSADAKPIVNKKVPESIDQKKAYAQSYYEAKRAAVLERKKRQYRDKKNNNNGTS